MAGNRSATKGQKGSKATRDRQRRERQEAISLAFAVVTFGADILVQPIVLRAILAVLCYAFVLAAIWPTEWWQRLDYRIRRLCVAVSAIALLCVGWVIVPPAWRAEQAAKTEGDLVSPPSNRYDSHIMVKDGYGTGTVFDMAASDGRKVRLSSDTDLRLERGPDGTVEVSTTIRDSNGNVVVDIDRNHWRISPDVQVSWDHNYTKNALEVLDHRKHVVFQIRLLPNTVIVQAIWRLDKGHIFEFGPCSDGADQGGCIMRDQETLIPTWFSYPSKEHWGEPRVGPFRSD